MQRFFCAAATGLVLLCAPAAKAAALRPLVNNAGVTQQIPNGDTVQTPAPTSGNASANLPHGAAPSAPVDGDLWTTSSGLYVRINGVTVGPLAAAGAGSPGGSNGQLQYNNGGAFGGFTMAGDCSLAEPAITCISLNGVAPGYFFNGADASHLTGAVGSAQLTANLSAALDAVLGSTRGAIAERGSGGWTIVAPGSTGYVLTSQGVGADPIYSPATGGVTSVGLSLPTTFSCSGSPITSSGTITCSYTNQSANQVFAGPASGSAAAPGFRSLVGADLPNPSASTLGGVQSVASASQQWIDSISTSGVPHQSQPAFTDISGNPSSTQLATNLSAAIDSAAGSTQGGVLYRGASAWSFLAPGSVNQVLQSGGAGANPSWGLGTAGGDPIYVGPAQIGACSGAPPSSPYCASSAGEGSLAMRTDVGWLYTLWTPPTAIPARVQEGYANTTFTVTMPSAPTAGDYEIAVCWSQTASAAANTGWTPVAGGAHTPAGAYDPYAFIVEHLVAPGETTTQTPCIAGSGTILTVFIEEVSGLDPTNFANSLQAINWQTYNAGPFPAAAGSLTWSTTTTSANTLGVVAANMEGANNCASSPPTLSSGWSHTVLVGFPTASSPGIVAGSQLLTSNGSTVSATAGNNGCGYGPFGYAGALILLQPSADPLTTSYQQVSYLTSIKNAGSLLTANARSINFSTGMSASTDADGNVTVTASGGGGGGCTTSGASILYGNGSGGCSNATVGTGLSFSGGTLSSIGGGSGTVTVTGVTPIAGHCVQFSGSTSISDTGATCGSGGGGSSGSGSLISETVTSGSQTSVTVAIPSGYRNLTIKVGGRSINASVDDQVLLQFNGDTGANYSNVGVLMGNTGFANNFSGISDISIKGGYIPAAGSTPSSSGGQVTFDVSNYANTSWQKSVMSRGADFWGTSSSQYFGWFAANLWKSSSAISAVKVFLGSGSGFSDGTVIDVFGDGPGVMSTGSQAGLVLLGSVTTVGGETDITFSSIPSGYSHLRLVGQSRSQASASSDNSRVWFNNDLTNGDYSGQQLQGSSSSVSAAANPGSWNQLCASYSAATASTGEVGTFEMVVPSYSGTIYWKGFQCVNTMANQSLVEVRGATWKNTAAINRIDITQTSGSGFAAGSTFYLYGVGSSSMFIPSMAAAHAQSAFGGL